MKKLIIAALSIAIGAMGYTVVDKTIEQRVSDLESSVSSLVEIQDRTYSTRSRTTSSYDEETLPDSNPTTSTTESTRATTATVGAYTYAYGYYELILPDGIERYDNLSYYRVEYSIYDSMIFECTAYPSDKSCRVCIGAHENNSRNYTFYLNGFKYFTCTAVNRDGKIYAENIKYFPCTGSDLTTTTTTIPDVTILN